MDHRDRQNSFGIGFKIIQSTTGYDNFCRYDSPASVYDCVFYHILLVLIWSNVMKNNKIINIASKTIT